MIVPIGLNKSHCVSSVRGNTLARNPYITGVGGWLALLIFLLMIYIPLIGLGGMQSTLSAALEQHPQLASSPEWQSYRKISWLMFWGLAALSFSAGYKLWKYHCPDSVRFAIISLWIILPLGNVLSAVLDVYLFGTRIAGQFIAATFWGLFFNCLLVGLWSTYLIKSVRVNNTYKMG